MDFARFTIIQASLAKDYSITHFTLHYPHPHMFTRLDSLLFHPLTIVHGCGVQCGDGSTKARRLGRARAGRTSVNDRERN